jgi:hypothetical protein
MDQQAKERCCMIIKSDVDKICEFFFRLIFTNEDYVWLMFSKLIDQKLKQRTEKYVGFWDCVSDAFDDVMSVNVILEIVFRHMDDKWVGFIWPFGKSKRIYIPLNNGELEDAYLLQCIQCFIMHDLFTIRESDIHSQHMNYTHFDMNLFGNKFIDRLDIMKTILSKLFETHKKYFERTSQLASINNTLNREMLICISKCNIPQELKNELVSHVNKLHC